MYSIGVDLGGTKICTGLLDSQGNLIASLEVETRADEGVEPVLTRIFSTIEKIMGDLSPSDIVGIGIAAPGPLNYLSGELHSPPNLPGWDCVPLRTRVANHFGIPTFLDNDANAAALAEHMYGAGKRADNMVYVTVSTGIGAGVILDGKLRRGQSGSAAEVGHMIVQVDGIPCSCGNKGCLEALASGVAISRRATAELGFTSSAKEVVGLANQGNQTARAILDDAFHYLGVGMVNVINLFDPSVVVIGGGLAQIGGQLFQAVQNEVDGNRFRRSSTTPVRVVPANLGTKAGVIGAAVMPFVDQMDNKGGGRFGGISS